MAPQEPWGGRRRVREDGIRDVDVLLLDRAVSDVQLGPELREEGGPVRGAQAQHERAVGEVAEHVAVHRRVRQGRALAYQCGDGRDEAFVGGQPVGWHTGRLRRRHQGMMVGVSLGSLDYLYTPSQDVPADMRYFRDVLGATVVFAFDRDGTRVAMLRLGDGPA